MWSSHAKIKQISDNLYQIKLIPPIRGFDDFISVWLYKGSETFIVDVGPSVTSADLIAALRELEVDQLDYILLTHIHLDHAGGVGELSSYYPKTPIICHGSGIQHLVDPERLIEGTRMTLGETGRAYGPIQPVQKERFINVDQFVSDTIVPVITPGHSQHHVSYLTREYLFVGEACGVCFSLPEEDRNFMRPATPPRFFLDITMQSIDHLMNKHPTVLCFSHFGIHENAIGMLSAQKRQLLLWNDLIHAKMKNHHEPEGFLEGCLETLLTSDPMMAGFYQLDAAVQERERGFLYNSIKGFIGYLKTVSDNP